jgi:cytochrome b
MSNTPSFGATAGAAVPASAPRTRRVVDAPTRMFHWLFALSFTGAYLTGESEHWRALHITLGWTMAGLLGFRLVYGLVGPRQARLSALWRKLTGVPGWVRATLQGHAPTAAHWRQGQNLLMGVFIAALLLAVVPLVLSGWATYDEWGGERLGHLLEEVHEAAGQLFLLLVLGHLALLAVLSGLRRRNLAQPMLTGRTEGSGPDLARRNHTWLAVLLLLAVLGYGAWEWKQAPNGLLPTASVRQGAGDSGGAAMPSGGSRLNPLDRYHARHHDDD